MPEPIDILHVSTCASPRELARIQESVLPGIDPVSYGMIEASHKFHGLLVSGVAAHDTRVHSLVGRTIGSAHRAGWWPRSKEKVALNHTYDHLSVINRPVIKQLWLALGLFIRTLQWRIRTSGNSRRIVIVDAAYVSALPGVFAALAGSGARKLGLFMDIYPYMANVADAKNRTAPGQGILRRIAQSCYQKLDGFLLLTEAMNEVVNPQCRPHLVIEGIVDQQLANQSTRLAKDDLLTVMYAGALRAEYGVADLIDAFTSLDIPEARLVVYGAGPYSPDVRKAAEQDPRIDFRGHADQSDVVAMEERVWLLVNPRPTQGEFTKYSFPSKVMEYLASGTAVLTTRLSGIPEEYFNYVYAIEADGVDALRKALKEALSQPRDQLLQRGEDGKRFVMETRNNINQGQRILELAILQHRAAQDPHE
ncbi:MAG: glycosyltransferase [Propionibacteriaceae bacterium]